MNTALDGRDAAATALTSVQRLVELDPRVLLPAHGPVPDAAPAALDTSLRRAQRLVHDPDGAVWYGARRNFAFAVMIRGGIPADEVAPYLPDRAWVQDAARGLRRDVEELASELVESMISSGAPSSFGTAGCGPPRPTPRCPRPRCSNRGPGTGPDGLTA